MTSSALVTALGVLTTISQIALTLSPVPDLLRVHRTKSTGVMLLSPLVAMWINNHLWVVYAYPVGNIFPLFAVALFGEVLSIVFTIFYAYWCKDRAYVTKVVALGLLAFVPVTVYFALSVADVIPQSHDVFVNVLGYLAVAMNFFLYSAPLEKVARVISTKSAESIPILMSCMIFANTTLWFISGVVTGDMFLLVPNAAGMVLSSIQIVLYFVYRPQAQTSNEASDNVTKLEITVDLESQNTANTRSPTSSAFQPIASPLAPIKT